MTFKSEPRTPDPDYRGNGQSPVALIVASLPGTNYMISEASKITGIPVSTLRRWYRKKITKAPSRQIKVGHLKVYLYTPEDLIELASHRTRTIELEDRK